MDIQVNSYKRCVVVKFAEVLDASNIDDLEAVLTPLIDKGSRNIILDLSEVDMLSSKGLGLLVKMQQKCKRFPNGELVLAGASPRILRSMKIVGMEGYFKDFDNITDAIGSF
jgi:anti-anti-sigma factor